MIAAFKQNKCNLSRNFERHHLQPFEFFQQLLVATNIKTYSIFCVAL